MSKDRKPMVFLDGETTGLDWDLHRMIEIAYMTEDMAEPITIFPYTFNANEPLPIGGVLAYTDPRAIEINKFDERYPDGVEYSGDDAVLDFIEACKGAMLVGANVRFDARMIENTFSLKPEPWHHRLFDLQAYAAGVLGYEQPIGWAEICEVVIPDLDQPDHSAAGDTRTVRQVYERLRSRALNGF